MGPGSSVSTSHFARAATLRRVGQAKKNDNLAWYPRAFLPRPVASLVPIPLNPFLFLSLPANSYQLRGRKHNGNWRSLEGFGYLPGLPNVCSMHLGNQLIAAKEKKKSRSPVLLQPQSRGKRELLPAFFRPPLVIRRQAAAAAAAAAATRLHTWFWCCLPVHANKGEHGTICRSICLESQKDSHNARLTS